MALVIKTKVRSDGVVQGYWVKEDDDGRQSIIGNVLNPNSRLEALSYVNDDDVNAIKQRSRWGETAGFVMNDEQALMTTMDSYKNVDVHFAIPSAYMSNVLRGEGFVDGMGNHWEVRPNSDGGYSAFVKEEDDWHHSGDIPKEEFERIADRVAEAEAARVDIPEYKGETDGDGAAWNFPTIRFEDEEESAVPPEDVFDDFDGDDTETKAWSATDLDDEINGDDAPTQVIDDGQYYPPIDGAYPQAFDEDVYYSAPEYSDYEDAFSIYRAGVNEAGYADWDGGFDAADFVAACNKKSATRDYLRDFGVREAPPGYPGNFIVEGINVSNPAQQRLIDALCNEQHAKELLRSAKSDPFIPLEELDAIRQNYLDAKKDSKIANSAIRSAMRERRFAQFAEQHPVAGGIAGRLIMGARLSKRTAGMVLSKKRARDNARTRKYQQQRADRLRRARDPRRGVFGLMKRFIISGIKFRFMERIWGRRGR